MAAIDFSQVGGGAGSSGGSVGGPVASPRPVRSDTPLGGGGGGGPSSLPSPPPSPSGRASTPSLVSRKMSYLEVLSTAARLADALRYMHDEADPVEVLLHRDLKPDNIGFLADGTVVLFDFGLATSVPRPAPGSMGAGAEEGKGAGAEEGKGAGPAVSAAAAAEAEALYRLPRYRLTGHTGSVRYMAPEVAPPPTGSAKRQSRRRDQNTLPPLCVQNYGSSPSQPTAQPAPAPSTSEAPSPATARRVVRAATRLTRRPTLARCARPSFFLVRARACACRPRAPQKGCPRPALQPGRGHVLAGHDHLGDGLPQEALQRDERGAPPHGGLHAGGASAAGAQAGAPGPGGAPRPQLAR